MRRVWGAVVAALCAVGGTSAQELNVVSDSGLVSVEWDSVPGVAYRLQSNADLASGWTNVGGGSWSYGLGQRFSYGVYAFDQGGSGPPSIPNPPSSTHTFAITEYAAQGKTLVSWQGEDGGQALIDSSQLPADLPPALALQVPDGAGGFYALTIVQVSVAWQAAYLTDASLQEGNLTTGQLLELAKLTGAYSQIGAAISGGGGSSQTSGAAGAGTHHFYQLQTSYPDTDSDGLLDWEEIQSNTDAFHPDSDRDGFPDWVEAQLGSDPSDAGSIPNSTMAGAAELLQEATVKLTGGASTLIICCNSGGRTWELPPRSGPATFPMDFSRGVLYQFKLGADTGTPAAIELLPQPVPPGTWNWWVETGDGQAAGGSTPASGPPPVAKSIHPVELVSDLDNDGEIGRADLALQDAGAKAGASAADVERATEFMFSNDRRSNGVGDSEDPGAPAGTAADDDAERIRVTLGGLASGLVDFDHPAIDGIKFYEEANCTTAVTFPFDLAAAELPEMLYARAEDGFVGELAGDLVLEYTPVGEPKRDILTLKLTIAHIIGDGSYFQAARDYMLEFNSRVCMRFSKLGKPTVRIVSMLHETTQMKVIEAYHRTPKLETIFAVNEMNANYHDMIINGNFCFFEGGIPGRIRGIREEEMTSRCHGGCVIGGVVSLASSTGGSSPFEQANTEYIASNGKGTIEISTGIVPLNPVVDAEALGGFASNLVGGVYNTHPWIGISEVGETGNEKKVLFTVTQTVRADAYPLADLFDRLKDSGVPELPASGGHILCIAGDGGGSTAIAHRVEGTGVEVKYAGDKHRPDSYRINTYLAFKSDKPRE